MKSPQLVASAGPTSAVLWQRLSSLFSAINIVGNAEYETNESVNDGIERLSGKEDEFVFQEDLLMRGMLGSEEGTAEEDLNRKTVFEGTELEKVGLFLILCNCPSLEYSSCFTISVQVYHKSTIHTTSDFQPIDFAGHPAYSDALESARLFVRDPRDKYGQER